jgi:hypothetical protein
VNVCCLLTTGRTVATCDTLTSRASLHVVVQLPAMCQWLQLQLLAFMYCSLLDSRCLTILYQLQRYLKFELHKMVGEWLYRAERERERETAVSLVRCEIFISELVPCNANNISEQFLLPRYVLPCIYLCVYLFQLYIPPGAGVVQSI